MVKGLYLTLLIGPTVPLPVPQMVLDALTSVEVHTQAERSGFQLSFTLSNRSPLHTLFLLAGGQQTQVRVIIVVTLNGVPSVLMDGIVANQQVLPGSDAGHSTLTITGDDLTTLMAQNKRDQAWGSTSLDTRVRSILVDYADRGIVPLVIPPLFTDVPSINERIPHQNGMDLAYIQALAKQVGHVFFIQPGPVPGMNVAYWGPKVKLSLPQPALSINMDAHTNVDSLSFTFDGRERTQYVVRILDATSKKAIKIPVPETTLLSPPLGAIPPLKVKEEVIEAGKLTMTEAMLIALAKTSASLDSVTGRGSLDVLRYGQILKARELVGVRGAGMAFDGLYYVNGVNHTLKPGEYKQSFDLSRNGLISTVPLVPA